MDIIKKNGAEEVRVVLLDTPTHYLGVEMSSSFVSGTGPVSIYAYPHSGYSLVGKFVFEEPKKKE